VLLGWLLVGCGEPTNHSRAAFVLMDISGSYAAERDQARRLTNYLLSQLDTGTPWRSASSTTAASPSATSLPR